MKNKVLVVDLDGTLMSINTFHYFIKYILIYGLKRLKLIFVIHCCYILVLRGLKRISHAKMKYSILKLISKHDTLDIGEFVKEISSKKNKIPVLNERFDIKILATAAPNIYADVIAKNEGFDVCISTKFPEKFSEDFQNIKEVKKNNVMSYLLDLQIKEIDVFVTDHIDDLPLMRLSKKNIIVSPTLTLITQLKQNNIAFETVN